ncbi:MAG: CPBP family intramembrane metalloprotease, partial [Isoptericola variabilis]|nr:CPBP family intramembrane metalloprotease [Isoptericola variabilis]
MTTDPQATPASATPASPVVDASPQGPASADPLPLPGEAVSSEAAPASSPAHPTRAEWV